LRLEKPKDGAIIAENDGEIIFGKEIRGKQKITIKGKMDRIKLFNSKR
jgi:hypothetical protein